MNNDTAQKLARRFIELPGEKRSLFLEKLRSENIDFSVFPIVSSNGLAERSRLSYAQQRMWFLWKLDPHSPAYNIPGAVNLSGVLDNTALQNAFNSLLERHEILRTVFQQQADGEIWQVVQTAASIALFTEDFSHVASAEHQSLIKQKAEQQALVSFDLEQGPLLRITLVKFAPEQHVLLLNMHHIIADGWSINVLLNEFLHFYDAYTNGSKSDLKPLAIQYQDYALWQRSWLEAGEQQRQLDYWLAQLGDEHPVLELPLDYPRPAKNSFNGSRQQFVLDKPLVERINLFARQKQTTLFTVLLAALKILLFRYTGQQDLRVGVPFANRNRQEIEGLIGCFINTQVLRTQIDPTTSVDDFLSNLRATIVEAQAHQDLPFAQLVNALKLERDTNRTPLFQVSYNHQANIASVDQLVTASGLRLGEISWDSQVTQFDLKLDTWEKNGPGKNGEEVHAAFTYASDLFSATTIERLRAHWITILDALTQHSKRSISDLPVLSQAEEQHIFNRWDSESPRTHFQSVHQLFENCAAETPSAFALTGYSLGKASASVSLSYSELNVRANRLAQRLRERGVGPNVLVAIAVDRSVEMVIGLLAVLKAGGAYVPLDPDSPPARILATLESSAVTLLLTQKNLAETLQPPANIRVMLVDSALGDAWSRGAGLYANPENNIQPANLAYVIYTSGSTGQSKGVTISHGALVNYLDGIAQRTNFPAQSTMAMVSTFAADLGHTVLFGALCAGHHLHLVPQDSILDPDSFANYTQRNNIDVIKIVPSHLQGLLHAVNPAHVLPAHAIILGGEACPQPLIAQIRELAPACRIINHYGPTETTVGILINEIIHQTIYSSQLNNSSQPNNSSQSNHLDIQTSSDNLRVPVGKPLPNSTAWILDTALNPVPDGISGELYLSGAGLAQGYLNRPGATAERFVPNPFSKKTGERLYRSGDQVCVRQDQVEYIGRLDQQIKIRGFRIEIGEIEARLRQLEHVSEAAVIAQETATGKQLVAYLVPDNNTIVALDEINQQQHEQFINAIKIALQDVLPAYMVPAHFLLLAQLPVTANGKLDRKALPAIDASELQQHYEAPGTLLERHLADIWESVLGVTPVGLNDNFFALGGHSLLVTQAISRIRQQLHIELPLRLLFEAKNLREFAELVAANTQKSSAPITPVSRADYIPASHAQLRQWLLWQLEPQSAAYNINVAFRLTGSLDIPALQKSLSLLLQRHEVWRTHFCLDEDNQLLQVIKTTTEFPLEFESVQAQETVEKSLAEYGQRPFDLFSGPLLRAKLIQLADDNHVLAFVQHHIISDAWSMRLIMDELIASYRAFREHKTPQLAALDLQYADYAVWQRQVLNNGEAERQLAYWRKQLGHEHPVLELPTDYPRPLQPTYAGANWNIRIPAALTEKVTRRARTEGVTLFMLLLASFKAILHRYSGQEQIRVGIPVANRTRLETEKMVGFFVNTQVIRSDFSAATTFNQLLQQVRNAALEAQAHQELPFEQLVAALQPERSLSHSPLFQVVFNYHSRQGMMVHSQLTGLGNLQAEELAWDNGTAHFDLGLEIIEAVDGLNVSFNYTTDLFKQETIERLALHWQTLLETMVEKPAQRITEISFLTDSEYQRVRYEWNSDLDLARPYATTAFAHQLFEQHVELRPDHIALVMNDRQLTYRELNNCANSLAHRLRQQGIGPEILVGIMVERSIDMVIGMLAVLKAGGAYVPMDPEYPQARLEYIIEDSKVHTLLTQTAVYPAALDDSAINIICLDQQDYSSHATQGNPELIAHADNLAYLIYTSGSTGKPKAVAVAQGPLAMHCLAIADLYGMTPDDRELQFASINFDGAHERWLVPLVSGATLMPRDNDFWDVERTSREIVKHGITIACFTPSYLNQLADYIGTEGRNFPIRSYTVGGEPTSKPVFEHIQKVLQPPRIVNGYGPTETVITPLLWRAYPDTTFDQQFMPIGRPVGARVIYIADAGLQLLPVGMTGELYIGGEAGIARGYFKRPGLTAERFIPDPFAGDGSRLYRSGDLASYRDDGVVECYGRIDHQVKIRGFRIELGEIEAQLHALEIVRDAAVLAQDTVSGKQLVAYVVPHDGTLVNEATQDIRQRWRSELKAALQAVLPDYMIPAHFVLMAQLPLSPNDKLDRKALPAVDISDFLQDYVAPTTALETDLATIWQSVLGVDQVGLRDNFFELGGDSIISLQLVSRARQAGIHFTPKDVFRHQTLADLSLVATRLSNSQPQAEQGAITGRHTLTPIQHAFFENEIPAAHHWNQSVLLRPVTELVDAEKLQQTLAVLVNQHDALRLRFNKDGQGWYGEYSAQEQEILWQIPVADEASLTADANRAQRSLDLANGPLLRAVLFTLPDGGQRVLLAIHHLVIDGVSWRILLEDLQQIYRQLERPALSPKTTAFSSWSNKLHTYASSPALLHELDYWLGLAEETRELPRDNPAGGLHNKHARQVSTRLDQKRTQELLKQAPAAYRTQVNDVLLTALARVICRWTGDSSALVTLEGHGREDLFDGVDLTRTLGWFTSVFPVKLTPAAELDKSIKGIKEQLRRIPHKGMGYGVLRYLGDQQTRARCAALPEARITFNYLGQFDGSFDDSEGSLFVPATENGGLSQSDEAPLANWLSINGQVYQGALTLNWTFSGEMYDSATIQQLADAYADELETVIGYCVDERHRGATPSDFPLLSITQQQLDSLPIDVANIQDIYPLAPMQQGMLFHSLSAPGEGAYLNQLRVNVQGLDAERFRAAWQASVQQHDILRTGIYWQGLDEPVQVVYRRAELPFHRHSATPLSADDIAQQRLAAGFDLAVAPLMSLDLYPLDDQHYQLILTNHHLLMDGWSSSRLFGEVLQRYHGQQPAAVSGRYRDYLHWLGAQDKAKSQAFWTDNLAQLAAPTLLADALGKPAAPVAGQGEHKQLLSATETSQLTGFARVHKVTVNTLVQAAWLLILRAYTGQDCPAFGATVAGRPAEVPGIDQQLGLFINTLPVVLQVNPEENIGLWLQRVQQHNALLRDYEHAPLYEIQRWAGQPGATLFDSLLVFENYPVAEALQQAPADLTFSDLHNHEQTNYGLTLIVTAADQLSISGRFDRRQFTGAAVAQLLTQLQGLLLAFVADANRAVGNLALLDNAERQQILIDWNATATAYREQDGIHTLFERCVDSNGDALAITGPGLLAPNPVALTYRELNTRANRLAWYLRNAGVGPDVLVGIALDRSVEMVVGLLAILKAGGAYVPLDPEYPAERLAYMVESSGLHVLLTQSALQNGLSIPAAVTTVLLDDPQLFAKYPDLPDSNPARVNHPANLAYVIYTSGSTGKPKGVAVPHQGVVSFLNSMARQPGIQPDDRVLALTSLSFDIAALELFLPLSTGASLLLLPASYSRNPAQLLAAAKDFSVTHIQATPSTWKMLVEADHHNLLQDCKLLTGGEALPDSLASELLQRAGKVWNLYGPTETTIWSACYELDHQHPKPYLGRPIDNTTIYIAGSDLEPSPMGALGELYIGGVGVTRGYYQRPGLTAERFIPDLFSGDGNRVYRTGDLARYGADGVIEYAGRIDHQVKIRGFRIEPGEIENRLHEQDSVRDVAVIPHGNSGNQQLVAYVVPTDPQLLTASSDARNQWRADVKQALHTQLPDYMVPAHWVLLETLPLTPNGKLNRKALPVPDASEFQREWIAPETDLEQQLAHIWQTVLDVERVGLLDNFFELGGHSILLIRVLSLIKNTLNIDLPPQQFYAAGTIRELARLIEASGEFYSEDDYGLIAMALDELDELEQCDV